MLDINLFRVEKGGDPERVRESQRRRYAEVEVVGRVVRLDEQWRRTRFRVDALRKELNELSRRIGAGKKCGEDVSMHKERVSVVKAELGGLERAASEEERERDALLRTVGNLVHESVPVSDDEAHNRVERTWGVPALVEERRASVRWSHVDLLLMLGAADYERGVRVAGSRGYFLTGVGVQLNLALVQYSLQFLRERGYQLVQPPYFMTREAMARCAQLDDFDEQLYKVVEGASEGNGRPGAATGNGARAADDHVAAAAATGDMADEDKYLIATSEQPLCAYYANEWIAPTALPILHAGFSTCFRKEAGSHGRDQLGIFRVHQFDKVEQFALTAPTADASWQMLERLLATAEEFYQSLGIPYQVMSIVSGALNNAAAKKYDLEGWFPASGAWRELVSCSNCTDFQARRLETRYGLQKSADRDKAYVHMLNSTLCATTRVICCLVENYQRDGGVEVPAALQPFLGGTSFLPFVTEPPKHARPAQS
ncbi:hypothetical protein CDCA_CDCA16G4209 [Cyanidium caldarium]|uniref:serine--tRNA ligase n=1 Tax=Cyanidium caldarium TaxID=2771 RepID=A0AAV9J110_CYACA|nr:hypothetical protein CDCA_CDCA16G4209 [Cyanidium caldarium]